MSYKAVSRRYKAVIFDWDGTVVDSAEHIVDSLLHAASVAALPLLERQAYRNIIGLGLSDALDQLYPGITREQMIALRNAYSQHFMSTIDTANHLFPGMHNIIADLGERGAECAVATGKSRRGLERAFQTTGIEPLFSASRCADETRSKPDPAMLRELLDYYGIHPHDAVMIGDTSYDMEMARRIDMPAIGVNWGVHTEDVLSEHKPLAIAASVDELQKLLQP